MSDQSRLPGGYNYGETLQFAFSDKDNMSEIEREDTVVKIP